MAFNLNTINQNTQYNLPAVDIQKEWSAVGKPGSHASDGKVGGWLPMYPIFCIPGEKHRFRPSVGLQFTPFVNNLFTELTGIVYSYFVPYRLIEDNWEEFITGGKDGQTTVQLSRLNSKQLQDQANSYVDSSLTGKKYDVVYRKKTRGNILDSMAVGLYSAMHAIFPFPGPYNEDSFYDTDYWSAPVKAYNLIYNECLRWPDYEEERDLLDVSVFPCHWNNDYITRARLYQQRGAIPLLPVTPGTLTETLKHEFSSTEGNQGTQWSELSNTYANKLVLQRDNTVGQHNKVNFRIDSATEQGTQGSFTLKDHDVRLSVDDVSINLNELMIDLGIMRYQINNARMQPRYIDQLKARFGVYPQDSRLQRPEYIGSVPIHITSQGVVNTAGEQGEITSQSFGRTDGSYLEYEVHEHGLILNLFCIKPMAQYGGFTPKQWFHKTRFDFPTPELANTPDVQIERKELSYKLGLGGEPDSDYNEVGLGWTDIYSEYRTSMNTVGGLLNPLNASEEFPTLDSWTLCRYWSQNNPPSMNASLIQVPMGVLDRVKTFIHQPDFIYFYRCPDDTAQPLPLRSEPVQVANI